jgi:hypothetical protein
LGEDREENVETDNSANMNKGEKTIKMKTLLFAAILLSGFLFCSTCTKKDAAPMMPMTTIIQIQMPNADGLPGTQLVFNYEVLFTPLIEFFGEAFPVKINSMASMNTWWDDSPRMTVRDDYIGDLLGDFGVTLSLKASSGDGEPISAGEPVSVRIEIEGDRFIRKSSIDVVMPLDREIEIFPRIVYDYSALERLVQPASENVYFRLLYGSVPLIEKMEVVRFHSVNEVPFRVTSRLDGESIIDYTWLFAAYVNEDDPLIDKILQEALQIGTAEKIGLGRDFSFSGYQIEDEEGDSSLSVDLQVLAIWSVFLNHNIKYSNITTTSTENSNMYTQYVRTLGESFGNSQANCVDGSVLFASALRKIGIQPFLILVPGHMFVGYLMDYDPFSIDFLETTMMGDVDISKHTKDDSFMGKLKRWTGLGQTQSSVTVDSFLAAKRAGRERYIEALIELYNKYEQDDETLLDLWYEMEQFAEAWKKLWNEEGDSYAIIDISMWRSFGIMPVTRY